MADGSDVGAASGEAMNTVDQQKQRQDLRRNIGIAELAKLTGWAELVHRAWPTATVWVFGSALTSKDFRDVDVVVLLPRWLSTGRLSPRMINVSVRLGT